MVELVYVGPPEHSYVDPPLGRLEPGSSVIAEDDVAQRLLATGHFQIAHRPDDQAQETPTDPPAKGRKAVAPPDTTAQED
jgi:hypothetical protein